WFSISVYSPERGYFAVVFTQITERKRAEEALRFQAKLLDTVGQAVIATDTDNKIIYWNRFAKSLYGWSAEEALGSNVIDITPADTTREQADEIVARLRLGESWSGEFTVQHKDGRTFPVIVTDTPIVDQQGVQTGIIGISMDISERKQAETALQRYTQRLGLLNRIDRAILAPQPLDVIGEMIAHELIDLTRCDAVRFLVIDNDDNTLGYLVALPPVNKISQDLLQKAVEHDGLLEALRRGKSQWVGDFQPQDNFPPGYGDSLLLQDARSWIITPLLVRSQLMGIIAIAGRSPSAFTSEHFDITREVANQLAIALNRARQDEQLQEHTHTLERRVTERTEQLNTAKERIEAILKSTSDAIIVTDMAGRIEQVNPAFTRLFGLEFEQGQPISLFSLTDSAGAETLQRAIDTMVAGGMATRTELMANREQGALFYADAALALLEDGQSTLLICSIRDVTLYKKAEENLRSALAHEQELNELKTSFTSLVSHEFRTPLSVILSSADLLTAYSERMTPERRLEKLGNIERQVKRLIKLLDDVLTITRTDSTGFDFKPTPLDLVAVCKNMIEDVRTAYGRDVSIDFTHQGEDHPILADEFLFSHILQNLASNAIKYSKPGGQVQIFLNTLDTEVTLRISDQGIGIPEQHQRHLFEAFQRADNVGQIKGTGIGLTIVKRAVNAWDGTIEVESIEGKGTTFTIRLPIASPEGRRENV
ncbi:MAG: PAS domain S-box protein, partial [Chloroflexota bacterium]